MIDEKNQVLYALQVSILIEKCIESVAMQLGTCEFTLTAYMSVSRTPQCAADKHTSSGVLSSR